MIFIFEFLFTLLGSNVCNLTLLLFWSRPDHHGESAATEPIWMRDVTYCGDVRVESTDRHAQQ